MKKKPIELGVPMKEPATRKQKSQLKRLGVQYASNITKYQASKLLFNKTIHHTLAPIKDKA